MRMTSYKTVISLYFLSSSFYVSVLRIAFTYADNYSSVIHGQVGRCMRDQGVPISGRNRVKNNYPVNK
jgi:ATP sulfurylase